MKKYILVIILSIISLVNFNLANAQVPPSDAFSICKNIKNGDFCSYNFKGPLKTELLQGRCDRWDDGRLYCNTRDPKGWTDCFNKSQPNDACLLSGDRKGTCQKVVNKGNNIECILDVPSQARDEWEACKGNKFYNGASCTYTTLTNVGNNPVTKTEKGFCDRADGISGDQFVCNKDVNGWKGCSKLGDACMLNNQLGVCKGDKPEDCDINEKPKGNPGGRSPGPGDGPCKDCGGSKCNTGQVCATIGGNKQCLSDSGANNTCGDQKCNTGQVCVTIGGNKQCLANQCTGGGGAGNGGGGTPPSGNDTPTDATAPQTVGFINPIRFNSLTELIAGIINALLGILGAITVGVLVKSGFEYMISSDPGAVGKALDGIKNAIVGLMIIMGAFLITQYVISALAGSSTATPPPNSPPDNSNQNPPKPAPNPNPPKPTPNPNPPKPAPKPPGTCGGKTCKPNEGCWKDASGNPTCISCDFLGC